MEHNDIRHKLSDYIDGSIPAGEKTAIEEHLKTCSLCSDALRELQKTVEHIKTIEEVAPPAWMTQKIMANVREVSQLRKGFFARWFLPLSVKLPIQAVAVLFLAVTAFYIYRNIPSAIRPSEAPLQEFAARKDKIGKAHESASRPQQVPRSPEYKALDMKPEYETPPPPIPQDQAGTPAEARQDERALFAKKEAAGEQRAAAQQPAPAMQREPARGASPRMEGKLKSAVTARHALNAVSADKTGPIIVVQVKDFEAAGREVEQAVTKLKGSITKRETPEAKRIYVITIDVQKFQELKNTLKLIGEVQVESAAPPSQAGRVGLTIELVTNSAHP